MTTKRKGYLLLLSVMILLIFSACGGEKQKQYPFELSKNARIYTFPEDNILTLKSIIIDENETEKIQIYEFDPSFEMGNKERVLGRIKHLYAIDASEENVVLNDVTVTEEETSYLILTYERSKGDIINLQYFGDSGEYIIIDIDSPLLHRSIPYEKYSAYIRHTFQRFDSEKQQWTEPVEDTYYNGMTSDI